MKRTPNFSIFKSFYAFLVNFSKDFVNWKTLKCQQGRHWLTSKHKGGDDCNVLIENVSNWHRKWQKSQNVQIFNNSMIFFQMFERLCGLEQWKGSTRKNVSSSRLFWGFHCSFLIEYISDWHRKWKEPQTFPFLKVFTHFLSIFCKTSWIGKLYWVNKEDIGWPVNIKEEMIAMF